jgi:hypothetical protein
LAQQSLENPYDQFHGWLAPFMSARSKLTESHAIRFCSQSASELAQRALRESSEDSNGEREKDTLTKGLKQRGNKAVLWCLQ